MPRNALVRVWPFAKPYLGTLIGSTTLAFVMVGLGMLFPPLTGRAIDDLSTGRTDHLAFYAGAVIVIGLVEGVIAFGRRYVAVLGSIKMERDMRNALFARLQRLPIAFHDGWQSGQLLSRVMGDLGSIRRFIGFGLIFLIVNVVQFLAITVIMLFLNPTLTIFTAAMAIPIALLARRLNRRYHVYSRQVQDDTGDLATEIEEATTGIRIIKAFGRAPSIISRFSRQADQVHASNMKIVRVRATYWPALTWLPAMNLAAVITVGGRSVLRGDMTLGDLNTFILYLLMLGWPIRSVGWILGMAEEARTAAERFFDVMDSPVTIQDAPGARTLSEPTRGEVRLEGVSFAYPGADTSADTALASTASPRVVLRNVNLTLRPGETMALVGATGSGKTTLASLIPRLIDPTEGRVLIDEQDVSTLTLSSLRGAIGVAFEDPVLFSMSARENLVLGHPNATDEDIERALQVAHATFVHELPWGLDTRVGEQGHSLSGGQRQRLALARAILSQPAVLVLDDPLSAVDVHTEEQIETALRSVLAGVTALIVVHRPSTVALCDRVALLHDGTIAAVGTHHDLMASEPTYRDILSMEVEREVVR